MKINLENISILRQSHVLYAIINIIVIYIILSNFKFIGYDIFIPFHIIISLVIFLGSLNKIPFHPIFDILIIPFVLLIIIPDNLLKKILLCIFGPISLGLNLSKSLSSVINITNFEDRGIKSGIILFTTYFLIGLFSLFILNVHYFIFLIVFLKLIAFIMKIKSKEFTIYKDYTKTKFSLKLSFLLLWLIFACIDATSGSILYSFYHQKFVNLQNIGVFISIIFMLIVGILIDKYGRRWFLLFSYAFLGMLYAFISLFGETLMGLIILASIPWSILTILFMMVIWGDICSINERSYYVAISFIIVVICRLFYLIEFPLLIQQIFSFITIFLFLATFVILLLPETLPESIKQKKELEDYIKKVKEIKKKYG